MRLGDEYRVEALDQALRSFSNPVSTETILARAEEFRKFLAGEPGTLPAEQSE